MSSKAKLIECINNKYPGGKVISRSLVYPINKVTIPEEYKKIYYPNPI